MIDYTKAILNAVEVEKNHGEMPSLWGIIIGVVIAGAIFLAYKALGKNSAQESKKELQQKLKVEKVPVKSKLSYSKETNYNIMKMIDVLAEIYEGIE